MSKEKNVPIGRNQFQIFDKFKTNPKRGGKPNKINHSSV
jgi:hypothetical protein